MKRILDIQDSEIESWIHGLVRKRGESFLNGGPWIVGYEVMREAADKEGCMRFGDSTPEDIRQAADHVDEDSRVSFLEGVMVEINASVNANLKNLYEQWKRNPDAIEAEALVFFQDAAQFYSKVYATYSRVVLFKRIKNSEAMVPSTPPPVQIERLVKGGFIEPETYRTILGLPAIMDELALNNKDMPTLPDSMVARWIRQRDGTMYTEATIKAARFGKRLAKGE